MDEKVSLSLLFSMNLIGILTMTSFFSRCNLALFIVLILCLSLLSPHQLWAASNIDQASEPQENSSQNQTTNAKVESASDEGQTIEPKKIFSNKVMIFGAAGLAAVAGIALAAGGGGGGGGGAAPSPTLLNADCGTLPGNSFQTSEYLTDYSLRCLRAASAYSRGLPEMVLWLRL